jgi:hypothetical protein
MEQYGSTDLTAIGDALKALGVPDVVPSAELGVLFYALGKVHRALSEIHAGRSPSDDTWFDLRVYAGMARAIRAGKWPTPTEEPEPVFGPFGSRVPRAADVAEDQPRPQHNPDFDIRKWQTP